jgi:membrane-bound serine protease (ClpP class)
MRRAGVLLVLVIAVLGQASSASARTVREVVLSGEINPVTASFVTSQIRAAELAHDAAVVLRIDTPGGWDTSMRDIVKHEVAASVPVIAWVAPNGARAASAGAFVLMASDLAAMAPQTNLGSATPISATGQNLGSDLRRKAINDAAAYMRVLAVSHDRNAVWAEQAVRDAANVTAADARRLGVIEIIAPDITSLLTQADGRRVEPKGIVLHTAGAAVTTETLPLSAQIVNAVTDPNVVFLLFLGGIALIAFEIVHPGVFLPGILGGVMLVMALVGLSVVPFNWAGALLLVAGAALIVGEAHVGHGLLGVVGLVTLGAGALLLFDTGGGGPAVSLPLVVSAVVILGGGLVLVITRTSQVRHLPPQTGREAMIGVSGEAREQLAPRGMVFVQGALWEAESDEPISAGEQVVVDAVDGLTLRVHPSGRGVS